MSLPNILLVIADDQPRGTLDAMPAVRSLIRDRGTEFTNAISQTSLCSPSRSSILTGKFSHNTGVWTNYGSSRGSWTAFSENGNETNTLATRLKDEGYYTALVGKYLNHFSKAGRGYVPPGWNSFITMRAYKKDGEEGGNGAYYDYDLIGTIPDEKHGSDPADYSTDVLRDKAREVIASAPADKPLFLMFTPWGPHGNYEPAPRHLGTWTKPTRLPGSFNESDMSDKPRWMQELDEASQIKERNALIRIHEALMSIDEAVAALLKSLAAAGRDENLLVIYASDNGKMLGSHRAVKKDLPHRWAAEVPLLMRWENVIAPKKKSKRVTPNVDITATIAEAAKISPRQWRMDGKSVLSTERRGTPVEQMDNPEQRHPAYCGWRTDRWLYVEYTAGEGKGRELYDYRNDPEELNNLAFDLDYRQQMLKLREKAKRACVPTPPGFLWRAERD